MPEKSRESKESREAQEPGEAQPSREATARRFTDLARRLDYRLARLELDLDHLPLADPIPGERPGELLDALLAGRRARRARIEAILEALQRDQYGRCEDCTSRIDANRLRRLPFALRCADCCKNDDADFRQHLASQHASIEVLLAAVRALIHRVVGEPAGGDVDLAGSDALAELLTDLEQELREHFALEETDSYLEELGRIASGLEPRIRDIQGQHRSLCEGAARLVARAREAGTGRDAWCTIQGELESFAAVISEHEGAERDLSRDAFLR